MADHDESARERHGEPESLRAWTADLCTALDLDPSDVDTSLVLDVAREVAHSVMRPAAPLSAYLLGVAVGRGAAPADLAETVLALAEAWPSRD
jgi:hypothetical protein